MVATSLREHTKPCATRPPGGSKRRGLRSGLSPIGSESGAACRIGKCRPIWETCGISEPPTDRPFGDLLEQWDKDEVDRWMSPGGWLWELMGPEQFGYGFDESEDEGGGFLIPGL